MIRAAVLAALLAAAPAPGIAAPGAGPGAAPIIVAPSDGETVPPGDLRLVLRVPPGPPAPLPRVLVNGSPVEARPDPATRGLIAPGATPPPGDGTLLRLLVALPPPPATCTVEVFGAAGGDPARVRVQVARPEQLGELRPRLILLSIGVSKYARDELTLRYPSKDARDLAKVFTGQAGLLFSEVKSRVLTDESAGKGHVLDGLEWLQRETTARDLAVLFLGGHAIRDGATGTYYFLPHDADPGAVKRSMISQEDVLTTLRALPGKVVVFLDTCFSGGLYSGRERSPLDIDSFVEQLAQAESGVVVLTSATGRQTAREAPEWNNGAFTKAVVEGLRGRAASAKRPEVTINSLTLYVTDRVKELTGGTQTPTLVVPRGVADFPIALPSGERRARNAAVPPSALAATGTSPPAAPSPARRGWVWAVVAVAAAVAVGATVTAVVLTREETPGYTPLPAF